MKRRQYWQSKRIADQRAHRLRGFDRTVFLTWYYGARLTETCGGDPDHEWRLAQAAGPAAVAGHIEGRSSIRAETGRW